MSVTLFEMENKTFITFTSYRNRSSIYKFIHSHFNGYKSNLPVYVLHKNNFTLSQTLVTFGAKDVEYFSIHGNHFLAVANSYNQDSDSVVYRWEAGKFKEFQRISTESVRGLHYFTINLLNYHLVSPGTDFTNFPYTNGKMENLITS